VHHEQPVEQADDDRGSPPLFALGVDLLLVLVSPAPDVDTPVLEVDVFDAQRAQLSITDPRVHRRRPQGPVVLLERLLAFT
jgi:hypothetical protein